MTHLNDSEGDSRAHEHRVKMRRESEERTRSILGCAGIMVLATWELANGYWPLAPVYDNVREPWWLFQTEIGLIQIGRRKRVIAIDWEHAPCRTIVTTDEVTKGSSYVHAWSVAKAVEYLTELRRAARASVATSAKTATPVPT